MANHTIDCEHCGVDLRNRDHKENCQSPEAIYQRLPVGERNRRETILRDIDNLVSGFASSLRLKLRAAEAKYGYGSAWKRDSWQADLRKHLLEHVDKGDPLDVAAYAAFAWHHKWSTGKPKATENGGAK